MQCSARIATGPMGGGIEAAAATEAEAVAQDDIHGQGMIVDEIEVAAAADPAHAIVATRSEKNVP